MRNLNFGEGLLNRRKVRIMKISPRIVVVEKHKDDERIAIARIFFYISYHS